MVFRGRISMLKESKAVFFEDSALPKVLSYLAPIEIKAITIGPMVFSKEKLSDVTKNHENIHWQQYIELGIFGFIFLYFIYYLIGFLKYRNGIDAYLSIPFEQEAYTYQRDFEYLRNRKRFNWLKYEI